MDVDIPYARFALDNGLTLLVHEDHSVPVVGVNVWYHVGSKNEEPGRTGFAHLFEHIMFEGSAHVPEGDFDNLLESAGGVNNGSTTADRTNYWENVPSSALELALWLEADRMGFLLETMTREKLDVQRSVVMNERRQSYENRPYGLAFETILRTLYPPRHPYHWPVIGSMEDLAAADLGDVKRFFRTYYAPNNASLAVAGDVETEDVLRLVERWFGDIPSGPPVPEVHAPPVVLDADRRVVLEDEVRLPRLYLVWPSVPRYSFDDAALEVLASVLADGKSSRLYRRLVYEEQVAQDVSAFQNGHELDGSFFVIVTGRPDQGLARLEAAVREELDRLVREGVEAREMERAVHQIESGFIQGLERVGGFGGKADRLNEYLFFTGDAGWVDEDLARFRALGAGDPGAAAARHLTGSRAVVLSVVPEGRADLAAGGLTGGSSPADGGGEDVDVERRGGPPPVHVGGPDRSVPPAMGPPPSMTLPEPTRFTLSGGLPVVLVEDVSLPIVSVQLLVRGGAAALGTDRSGLASLTADMLDEGAGGRSALEISDAVERLGAILSSTAGFDASEVELTVLRPRLEPALDLMADVVLRPAFPAAELERVRTERLTRIVQDLDEPRALATNAFARVLYGEDHPWGAPLVGTPATLRGLGRDDLVEFWRTRYRPENATLVVVGDVGPAEGRRLLEARFGAWGGGDAVADPAAAPRGPAERMELPEAPPIDRPVVFLVDRPGAAQSEIRIGRVAVSRGTPDYFALTVLNTVLGGSFTSRLNARLREEKGYTYGAGSGFSMRTRPGPFLASAAVHTPVTDGAVVEFLREIRGICEERVPDGELRRAKNYVALRLPQRFETVGDVAARIAEQVLYRLPDDYFETFVERVMAVTPEDVLRVAREHLDPQRMVVVVAGDRARIEEPLRALGIGPVVVLPPADGS